MVRIRLRRTGAKKQAQFRIVVADQRKPRDGKFLEIIGHYNPRTEPETVVVDEGRALYWMNVGAQPSDSIRQIFTKRGTMERFERLRKGEDLETLIAEGEAANEEARKISPRTYRVGGMASVRKTKSQEEATEAEAAA